MSLELTPSQTVGPFFAIGLTNRPLSEVVPAGSPGAITISGRVTDGAGAPINDAMVEIRHADPAGVYRPDFGWARCGTDADGRYSFVTVKPGAVQDEDGVPQAPHVLVMVFSRGLLKQAVTRMYFSDEQAANAADPILQEIGDPDVVAGLVAERNGDGYRFDIRMQGDDQTPFFAW
jgi:protocatechuate 3,4-dioxygenase alpha subunit